MHVGLVLKRLLLRTVLRLSYKCPAYSVSFRDVGKVQKDDQFLKTTCSTSYQKTKEEEEEIYLDAISTFYSALNQNDW